MDNRAITELSDQLIETGEALAHKAQALRITRGEGHSVVQLLRECAALASNAQLDVQEFIHKYMSSDAGSA